MLSSKQPLWLPPGSVRAILALVIVIAFVVRFSAGAVDPKDFAPFVTLVIGYYFGQKVGAPPIT